MICHSLVVRSIDCDGILSLASSSARLTATCTRGHGEPSEHSSGRGRLARDGFSAFCEPSSSQPARCSVRCSTATLGSGDTNCAGRGSRQWCVRASSSQASQTDAHYKALREVRPPDNPVRAHMYEAAELAVELRKLLPDSHRGSKGMWVIIWEPLGKQLFPKQLLYDYPQGL
jgi:hypothetical protein